MSNEEPKPVIPGAGNNNWANEVGWALNRLQVIFRYWTMPPDALSLRGMSPEEGVSARALALIVIVALTFAIRGEADSTTNGAMLTLLAGGLAAAISVVMNQVSSVLGPTNRDHLLISTYASTILVMLIVLVCQTFLIDLNWYQDFEDLVGAILGDKRFVAAPAILGVVVTYVVLLVKARFWDGNELDLQSVLWAFAIVASSGVLVFFVAFVRNDVFRWLISQLRPA
ncbi:hypothetical protein [Pseudorhodoplanes sp.]|jgi:hypothetical protein|uniref:hypothetical protein n=1 Tax=Pseudorhodoplanes sp. TaxID=1934341 RepID=UPI002D05FCA2|nr:hypothetical protein [Pseudorhodoplanes sp.]HWV40409.1 hypothetical protein [Pseudorhodoplanes sp.]